ncbi:uncharacterized protein CCR75_009721 [Bremia lactucae]|uniref:Uncharacterized protein n=1 Tax=Bremia lactucae TaxID=4779 RepID=A0A976IBZ9_BRELC|nr:hypothetical protein CCR75_009721 [Bremia lactucae]
MLASTADEVISHNEGTNSVTRLRVPSDKSIANYEEERLLSRVKGYLQKMGLSKTPSHSLKNANVARPGKNDEVATETFAKWVVANSNYRMPDMPDIMKLLQLSDVGMAKALTTAKFSKQNDRDLLVTLQGVFIQETVMKQKPNDAVVKMLRESFPKYYAKASKDVSEIVESSRTKLVSKEKVTF